MPSATAQQAPSVVLPGLRGRAIVVAGAARGMGRAVTVALASGGARLVVADNQPLGSLTDELFALGAEHEVALFDTADEAQCTELAERCLERYGRIDGAVTTAAVMETKPLLEITSADFERLVRVNLLGSFSFLRACALRMRRGGSIVLFASTAARGPRPLAAHYAATKAGVASLARSAAVALGPAGIRVNAICPGLMDTPMMDEIVAARSALTGLPGGDIRTGMEAAVPLGRLGTPEEVAGVAAFLLSDAAAYVSGELVGVTGGTDGTV